MPHLVIRTERSQVDAGAFAATGQAFDRGIDWAANDTILIVDDEMQATLLAVGRGG